MVNLRGNAPSAIGVVEDTLWPTMVTGTPVETADSQYSRPTTRKRVNNSPPLRKISHGLDLN